MSAVGRLAAFFVAPAVVSAPQPLPPPAEPVDCVPSPEPRAPHDEVVLDPEIQPGGASAEVSADPPPGSSRERGEAGEGAAPITSPSSAPVGRGTHTADLAHCTDGSSARRLSPVPDAAGRPRLRLVPPLAVPTSVPGPVALPGSPEPGTGAVRVLREERGAEGALDPTSPTHDSARGPAGGAADRRSFPEGPGVRVLVAGDVRALRVCILGDGRASAVLARMLAARLAREGGARCALLVQLPGAPTGGSPFAGLARPAARRLARTLSDDGLAGTVRGRVVELALSKQDAAAELARAAASAGAAPIVLALPATRSPELDGLLAGQGVALLVVRPGAPSALTALAVGDMERTAPGTSVRTVMLPARGGSGARRAAVLAAVGALR